MKHCGGEWVWWFGLVKESQWRVKEMPQSALEPDTETRESGGGEKNHVSVCRVQVHLCDHGIRHRPAERLLLETTGGSGHSRHHRRWWDACTACSSTGKKRAQQLAQRQKVTLLPPYRLYNSSSHMSTRCRAHAYSFHCFWQHKERQGSINSPLMLFWIQKAAPNRGQSV